MKTLIFDTGPIISLTTNNLLWVLEPLKKRFKGKFYITQRVKKELVDVPLTTKKYKFEALQVLHMIEKGVLEVFESKVITHDGERLLSLANKSFKAKGKWINLLQAAETEVMAAASLYNAEAIVVDERTTRMFIEQPQDLKKVLVQRLHTKIDMHKSNVADLRKKTKNIHLLRSTELVLVAYELGLLDNFIGNIPDARKQLLQSLLWGLKIRGCSITREEIDEIVKHELTRT